MQAYDAGRFESRRRPLAAFVTVKQLDIVIDGVPMLLDTGADVSLLPRLHVARLQFSDATQYELEAIRQETENAWRRPLPLNCIFLEKPFAAVSLMVDGHGMACWAENVLNNLSLLFDGPSQTWVEKSACVATG